jgi:hypothetical protein
LLDGAAASAGNRNFLADYAASQVVAVGSFVQGILDLERRLNVKISRLVRWRGGPGEATWKDMFPRARCVVACPLDYRRLLLQAACLAGAKRAPLYLLPNAVSGQEELARLIRYWRPAKVYAVGSVGPLPAAGECQVMALADEAAVSSVYLREQSTHGSIENLVVANPADGKLGYSAMSPLAPWLVIQRRAALLLTDPDGRDVEERVDRAMEDLRLQHAEALILMADLKAIPMCRRSNPIPGSKDRFIEMEPLTPRGDEPFTFATGRLFHADRGIVPLLLARQRRLASGPVPRKVLVVSDPSDSLPLLGALSGSTTREFVNGGYETTAISGKHVQKDDLRRLLPDQDIFLWEGHYNTLMKEYRLQDWPEPLRTSLVFLQSCLALNENQAPPLLEHGALSIIGTSTRTYSGTGGACALAFFDALLYDSQPLGSSLRHAKNFLLAYSLLKEKRLGTSARMTGANIRSAWAFTLWGDPTLNLPRPPAPPEALPPVRHHVHRDTITISLPEVAHDPTHSGRFQARLLPNGRLAGLVSRQEDGRQSFVPFVFVEVRLPDGPPGAVPCLRSRLPARRWVFCWDGRRNCGYLLVTPRDSDGAKLRFHVAWQSWQTVRSRPEQRTWGLMTVVGAASAD